MATVTCFGLGERAAADATVVSIPVVVQLNAHYDPNNDERPAYGQMLPRWNRGGENRT